jgi:hypothetical protein
MSSSSKLKDGPNGGSQPTGASKNIDNEAHDGTITRERLIKLISVKLKEAAMDSPSFRASTNYQNSQVDQIEQWIDGLLKAVKRYPSQFTDFKEFNSVMAGQLIPDFLKTSMVDQDTTLSVLDLTKINLESLWDAGRKDLNINDSEITDLLTEFSKKNIKAYKDMRKNLEYLQSKYDSFLSKFVAQSKTREPSALREDAFQLYDVRQSYLAASLDICVETSKFQNQLNTMLLMLSQIIFGDKSTYDANYDLKIKAWLDAECKSIKSLLQDMKQSRAQIEKATVSQWEPSRDLKDHNVALINPSLLLVPDYFDADEKHGWLFMKTTVGKPARQIWVRRWVFVKNGIFGLLSLAPSKNFVQETDKIGVLLANIRYAPDEDRRFCFEVKTIDCTIVFQAESLKELKEWLTVFAYEKEKAINASDNEMGKYAFGRYPPLFHEFASTSLTSVDIELTSSRVENSNHDDTHALITSCYLANLVDGSDSTEFKFSTSAAGEFREPDLNPPMNTARSKLALISHAFLQPTVIPTAVTANIWGSVNWGIYYMNDSNSNFNGFFDHTGFSKNNLTSLRKCRNYPSYYPAHLRNYDIQLKSLFESAIDPEELVVAHFTCLWGLNPSQELSGRCFLTTKCAYFYLNSTGFVSLMKKPLVDLVAADITTDKSWDVLKVYDVDGLSMRGRVFLEDGVLVQKKMELLINNMARSKPKPQSEIIPILESLHVEAAKKAEATPKVEKELQIKGLDELNSFQIFRGADESDATMRTNYLNEYNLVKAELFNAPAKAVFHIMYGDHSSISRDTLLLIDTDEFNISPWYPNGKMMTRVLDYKIALSRTAINLSNSEKSIKNRSIQTIEEFVDNKYYRVEDVRNSFETFGGDRFSVLKKVVIIETDAKTCKVLFYSKVKPGKGSRNPLISKFFGKVGANFQRQEIESITQKIHQSISNLGTHGQVIKAIRTYGNLSQSEQNYKPKDDVIFHLTFGLLLRYYFKKILFYLTSVILNVGHYSSHGVSQFILGVTTHKVLIFFLILSVLSNVFLMGRSTVAFWNSRNSANLIKNFRKQIISNKMERAISLNDLEILTSYDFNSSAICFNKFMSSITTDDAGYGYDQRIRESRHHIALKRNELLVDLKILEKVEKELVAGDYKNFVLSELNLCKISLDEMHVENESLSEYCDSCLSEYKRIARELL